MWHDTKVFVVAHIAKLLVCHHYTKSAALVYDNNKKIVQHNHEV